MKKQLLTISEFCQAYGVGRTRAYELIAAGKIEAVKIGASTRITAASAEKWQASLPPYRPGRDDDGDDAGGEGGDDDDGDAADGD